MNSTIVAHLDSEKDPRIKLTPEAKSSWGTYRFLRLGDSLSVVITTEQAMQIAEAILAALEPQQELEVALNV